MISDTLLIVAIIANVQNALNNEDVFPVNTANAQSIVETKQPQDQKISSEPAPTGPTPSGPDEDIFDDFDIDAPFDEDLDIGVDWPDEQDDEKTELNSNSDNSIAFDREDEETLSANDAINNDAINIESISIENGQIDIEQAGIAIDTDAPEALTETARQEALNFEDDVQLAQENDLSATDVALDTDSNQNYRILFSGIENINMDRIFSRFDNLSALKLQSNAAANGSQILRRAKTDTQLLEQLFRLEGYYDNLVVYRIISSDDNLTDINVILDVVSGPQYRYGSISLPGLETSEDASFLRAALAFEKGDVVKQDSIVDGKALLENRLLNNGYPFGSVGEPDLLIDHARREGDLTLPVSPDRKYNFGRIITGQGSILSGKHLENIARFEQGDLFQQSNVNDLRQAIFATSLASNVQIEAVPSATNADQVDLNVELKPAPPRTIAGLIGFNTGEGFRVETSWEHRNFFPPEGAINIAGILGTREQAAGVTYRRNNFKGRDRVLTASFRARNQNLDAFDARSLDVAIGYERQTTLIFQKKWAYNIGVEYSLSDERAVFDGVVSRELFNILSLPAGLSYDGSNDLLDPTKGFRLSARVSPEISTGVDEIAYFKAQIDGSVYQPVNDNLVIAGRIRLASISGAETSNIAPSRRNYAGGGGSVRGFGFQDIGPVDLNGNPAGGRGLAEFAIEARYRIGSFGIVPFIDAGGVSDRGTPDFSDIRLAAGLGLRYYTSFGPVRIDVGTPFNRRDGEGLIAVAISLGQAF